MVTTIVETIAMNNRNTVRDAEQENSPAATNSAYRSGGNVIS